MPCVREKWRQLVKLAEKRHEHNAYAPQYYTVLTLSILLYSNKQALISQRSYICQYRNSPEWLVFLSLDGMPHRRNYNTIWFLYVIQIMLPILRNVAVKHKLCWFCPSDVHHRKLHLILTSNTCHHQICESTEHSAEQKPTGALNTIFLIVQNIKGPKPIRAFLFLFRYRYCVLNNIKSIRKLVMFRNKKWNIRSFI